MGNQPLSGKGTGDLGVAAMKGYPILFHTTHSPNIVLSMDKRQAQRAESFCKGICFSNRPIAMYERVYLKIADTSSSWSGVLRFGYTSHDPTTINGATLPRYACPDLTNKQGYWAKALGERYSQKNNVLYFYYTKDGDVMYGLNNEEKGVFFSGLPKNTPLWGLVDIYGNTTVMEFIDGKQLNNLSPSSGLPVGSTIDQSISQALSDLSVSNPPQIAEMPPLPPWAQQNFPPHSQPVASNQGHGEGLGQDRGAAGQGHSESLPVQLIKYHSDLVFQTLQFHDTVGKNIRMSSDKTCAVRLLDKKTNGYVFTSRPLRCGEKLVTQILSVVKSDVGGLAFGVTACDPTTVRSTELPDDADLLLDRLEYWVVCKDVATQPDVGDELSFHLTNEGEVKYGKNGQTVSTLMHVDKTLPLWAFLDVHGTVQKVKLFGAADMNAQRAGGPNLMVALPPRRNPSSSSLTGVSSSPAPPPRPPPIRTTGSIHHDPPGAVGMEKPPALPPKPQRPPVPKPGTILTPTPVHSTPAPPPRSLIDFDGAQGVSQINWFKPKDNKPAAPEPEPAEPSTSQVMTTPEAADNAANECSVCLEKACDCCLYTCGHMCLCFECANDIYKTGDKLCPICRQEIKDIIKIFRS